MVKRSAAMQRQWLATLVLSCALGAALVAACFTPVTEVPPTPDAGGCPAGDDCGGGLLPDAGCPIGEVCSACDAGLVLVDGSCVSPVDAGTPGSGDAGPTDAGPPGSGDAGPADAGPPGQLCLSGTLSDAESMSPVSGATVTALDLEGVPILGATSTSGSDGAFQLCPPMGVTFTTEITAAGYPVTYFESIALQASEALGSLPVISSSVINELGIFLPGGLNLAEGTILVPVRSMSGTCSLSGWSVAVGGAAGPDGGPGYQLVYLGTSGIPSTTLTSTTSEGAAVIYDLPPPVASIEVSVTATNPAAGSCTPDNAALGFTGQVQVASGALSIAPIVLP
jgi:hypothetical protein